MKKDTANIGLQAEIEFALLASSVGIEVLDGQEIRCRRPVADEKGIKQKRVTHTDFTLHRKDEQVFPKTMHVEILNGESKHRPDKKAQQRVATAAGVRNYRQLSATNFRPVATAEIPTEEKRSRLFQLLKWE